MYMHVDFMFLLLRNAFCGLEDSSFHYTPSGPYMYMYMSDKP